MWLSRLRDIQGTRPASKQGLKQNFERFVRGVTGTCVQRLRHVRQDFKRPGLPVEKGRVKFVEGAATAVEGRSPPSFGLKVVLYASFQCIG